MKNICGIYSITNILNNKIYIGYSTNCYYRFAKHKSLLCKNNHHNIHLQNAWNKYGIKNFEFAIIDEYDEDLLPSMENWWSNQLNVHNRLYGYNISLTSPLGKIRLSKETIKKISSANTGKVCTQETKNKLSQFNLGKVLSEETKTKLKNNKKNKKVDVYDNLGNFIITYNSIRSASRNLKVDNKNISKCIHGDYNLLKNKIFKYHGEDLTLDEITKRNKNSLESKKIKVIGYRKDGSLIGKYDSCYQAGKENNLDSYKISLCIKNKQKTVKGTIWRTL